MSSPSVVPDFAKCSEIAGVLRQMQLPKRLVRQPYLRADRWTVGNFNLCLVAICHQTQSISGTVGGRWCRGWDYLERKLEAHSRIDRHFLEMENLATLSANRLDEALAPAPPSPAFPDVEARASLINEVAHHMLRAGYKSFEELCGSFDYRCLGQESIISFLKATKAYGDPSEKKARLLIGLLRDAHGWEFRDAHKLGAPVDYHEIRGHLRIGTVIVKDSGMRDRFRADAVTDCNDIAIRAAISEAIVAIAEDVPGNDALKVHYILWNYFRSLCRRYKPICSGGEIAISELDSAYVELFQTSTNGNSCVFSSFCKSYPQRFFPIEYSYRGSYY
jgi:hypothetical protein